jgi:hypothetical protein
MATSQKFTPRTKHIALKYHHFRGTSSRDEYKLITSTLNASRRTS